jgi:hypothetical protein
MSQTIQTEAALLALFADGQAIGSITPEDARDLIVSVGNLALGKQQTVIYDNGTLSTSLTLALSNGSVQRGTFATSSACTIALASTGLDTTYFAAIELYAVNNSAGSGNFAWPSNVSWIGSTPQPIPQASVVTKFRFETIDGGNSWSILL